MKKDDFEKQFEKNSSINFSFDEISSKINYEKYEKKNNRKSLGLKIGIPSGLAIFATVLTIWLVNSKKLSIEEISILNKDDLVVQYEKNAKFIDSGIVLEKTLSDGKNAQVAEGEFTVDSHLFSDGQVGTYHISVFLNETPEIKTGYDVEVINDEISEIQLFDFRSEYYIGERVIPQDITLNKLCTSGTIREAKITEYIIDDSKLDANEIGTYTIDVILKSNNTFRLSYEINVNALENADLNGRYAYRDEYRNVGHPIIYTLDIVNDTVFSRYSEILMKGKMIKEVVDGEIYIRTAGNTQTMTYKPATRTLLVTGIAGDPDMPCFRLNRTDYLIKLEGQNIINNETRYVAIDGKLSKSTLDYLTYTYGGSYLDVKHEHEITKDTIFEGDSTIYVGVRTAVNDDRSYVGIWYYSDGKVKVHFKNEYLYYSNPNNKVSYTVQDMGNGEYWLRGDLTYVYNKKTDTITILDAGISYMILHRFNPKKHAFVTLKMSYNSINEYVVVKGESLKTIFYDERDIKWYSIPGYNNEPIFKDITFNNVGSYTFGFIDIRGIHGDVKDYVRILGSWSADKLDSEHPHWLEVVENYQRVKLGWIIWTNIDFENGTKTFVINYEDGTFEEVIYSTGVLKFGENQFKQNQKPWQNFEVIGNYTSQDGEHRSITDFGGIYWEETSITGYTYTCSAEVVVTSVDENIITGYYIEQSIYNERIVHDIIFEKIESKWFFIMDGKEFIQN